MLNQMKIFQGNFLKADAVIREFGNQVKNFCIHENKPPLKTDKTAGM